MTKALASCLFALLVLTGSASAQDGRYLSVGPYFSGGATIPAGDTPEGTKTKATFAWTAGALGELDFAPGIAFDLLLAVESRPRHYYRENDEDMTWDFNHTYFSVSPMAVFKGVMIGLGFRIPVSQSVEHVNQYGTTVPLESADLRTVVDFKFGGMIPIINTSTGQFDLTITGIMGINDAFPPGKAFPQKEWGRKDASLQLGLTYLFHGLAMKY